MKSFLIISLMLAVMTAVIQPTVEAQVLTRQVTTGTKKDSVTAAGTKYFSLFTTATGVTGISLSAVKAATGGGTVNSYAIIQVRTDTMTSTSASSWIDYVYPGTTKRDTLFLTDVTTVQGYQWPVPVQFFNGVRAKVVSTGAQKFYVYFSALKR